MNSTPQTSCKYFLTKKKRNCRLTAVEGNIYCVEHILLFTDVGTHKNQNTRIKCPLDPSHTCDAAKLNKHLKKCNAKKIIPNESWYIKDINLDGAEDDTNEVEFLKDVSVTELKNLIEKLHKSININTPVLNKEHSPHPALVGELDDCANSISAIRQLEQNSSLLVAMEDNRLLDSSACYIEFGAGRGQLTTSVIKSIQHNGLQSSSFVLVDRGTNRRKLDAKFRQDGDFIIQRLRTDIKDLSLCHLDVLQTPPMFPIVAISKHLCGVATDFALKCLVQTSPKGSIKGGIIALCCHHRCGWNQYCGKAFFKSVGLSARDFSIISLISSWAVCHFRPATSDKVENEFHFITNEEKVNAGILCKNIIDQGRVEYLKENGFDVKLIEYTNKKISLENIALLFNKSEPMQE